MEFQEFLSNFGDLAARQDEWSNWRCFYWICYNIFF
jgi:hypothetical protein